MKGCQQHERKESGMNTYPSLHKDMRLLHAQQSQATKVLAMMVTSSHSNSSSPAMMAGSSKTKVSTFLIISMLDDAEALLSQLSQRD
jgi:hypothetical protein